MSNDPIATGAARSVAAATDDPLLASVVTEPATTLSPVPASSLRPWRLLDVLWRGPSHPHRWLVAVDGERVLILSGAPDRWDEVTADAEVASTEQAVELARVLAHPALGLTAGGHLLSDVDDIRWLPHPSDEQRQQITQLQAELAGRITPASVVGEDPWTVTLWARVRTELQRLEVEVRRDGRTHVTTTVEAHALPVPVSV